MKEQKDEIIKKGFGSEETKIPEATNSYTKHKTVKSKKLLVVGLLALVLIASALFFLQKNDVDSENGEVLSAEVGASKEKIEAFINENLMPEGSSVTITEFVADENYEDLYKV
ncbi:hypothetical protein KAT92_03340, partial [Candidatus Babeliales bacterium]|nr:hypothetical protein [Candidatus Babeliales bacterium]